MPVSDTEVGEMVSRDEQLLDCVLRDRWLGSLDPDTRVAVTGRASLVRLNVGEYVFRKGDAQGGFYALVEGNLKVSTLREDGKEGILVVLEPIVWFGEATTLDGLPRTHDVTALVPSSLFLIERHHFDHLMERASFAKAVALLQANHIRVAYAMLEDATLRSTRARIARRLQRLVQGDISLEPTQRNEVNVTHDTLAMMLGITRQTLALELKSMAARGAISLSYGRIAILSLDELKAIEREP